MENPKKILERLGTWPKKKLGQNFLVHLASAEKIYQFAQPQAQTPIIEIGPGLGAMTEVILGHGHPMLCIEKDPELLAYLKETYQHHPHFWCIAQDFLDWRFKLGDFFAPNRKPDVISNLPYSVTTPIIEHLFAHRHLIGQMSFLLQREFVERICASVGTKNYGRLSVWLQCYYDVVQGPVISPHSFHPRPTVDSRLVKLIPKKISTLHKHGIHNEDAFFKLIKTLFSQRRKMIRSSLSHAKINIQDIDETFLQQRPEALSISDFIQLYACIAKH